MRLRARCVCVRVCVCACVRVGVWGGRGESRPAWRREKGRWRRGRPRGGERKSRGHLLVGEEERKEGSLPAGRRGRELNPTRREEGGRVRKEGEC